MAANGRTSPRSNLLLLRMMRPFWGRSASCPLPLRSRRPWSGRSRTWRLRERPVVDEARERLLESFKLRYYFGGQPFAYRETDRGKEILAVGFKSMGRLFGVLNPEQDEAIISSFAEPW